MDYDNKESIKAFWNSRAGLGLWAGTNDIIAKEIEMLALGKYIKDGMKVLEAGCGNGVSAIHFASKFDIEIVASDFAEKLLEEAKSLALGQKLKGKIDFRKVDILNITDLNGEFDIIYTERVIINLMSWDAQKKAIINILSMLKPNGMFLMCENSEDGLNEINNWRAALNLKSIEMPWHNRYLKDSEISEVRIADVSLEEIDYYSSTYYLLSRVLNAALARDSGLEPSYESPINQMALKLPSIGKFGQGRIWVWRKKQPKAIGD